LGEKIFTGSEIIIIISELYQTGRINGKTGQAEVNYEENAYNILADSA